jgi:hypothetical protein
MRKVWRFLLLFCLVWVSPGALAGCAGFREALEKIEAKLPDGELCVIVRGVKVCAVRKDGRWTFSGDLSAEERAEVEAKIGEGGP